jgi:hypothetical protein
LKRVAVSAYVFLVLQACGSPGPTPTSGPTPTAGLGAHFDHLVVIAMENKDYSSVFGTGTGSSAAPFLSSLLPLSATIPNYHSYGASFPISGCSAACYTAVTSGNTYGVSDGVAAGSVHATNLMDRLQAAGLTWEAFCEDGCLRGPDHFPFWQYADTVNSPNNLNTTSPTDPEWIAAMNSANPPNLIWLTPTDNHNMHNNSISTGDAYVKNLLVGSGTIASPAPGSVFASNLFKPGQRTALLIWWDEYDPSPNLLYGPSVKPGFISSSSLYDEYATLHTIESNWGLATLTNKDSAAPVMTDLFQ